MASVSTSLVTSSSSGNNLLSQSSFLVADAKKASQSCQRSEGQRSGGGFAFHDIAPNASIDAHVPASPLGHLQVAGQSQMEDFLRLETSIHDDTTDGGTDRTLSNLVNEAAAQQQRQDKEVSSVSAVSSSHVAGKVDLTDSGIEPTGMASVDMIINARIAARRQKTAEATRKYRARLKKERDRKSKVAGQKREE